MELRGCNYLESVWYDGDLGAWKKAYDKCMVLVAIND